MKLYFFLSLLAWQVLQYQILNKKRQKTLFCKLKYGNVENYCKILFSQNTFFTQQFPNTGEVSQIFHESFQQL